jgi:hypothetical protein
MTLVRIHSPRPDETWPALVACLSIEGGRAQAFREITLSLRFFWHHHLLAQTDGSHCRQFSVECALPAIAARPKDGTGFNLWWLVRVAAGAGAPGRRPAGFRVPSGGIDSATA